jgi:hypothetical protein
LFNSLFIFCPSWLSPSSCFNVSCNFITNLTPCKKMF